VVRIVDIFVLQQEDNMVDIDTLVVVDTLVEEDNNKEELDTHKVVVGVVGNKLVVDNTLVEVVRLLCNNKDRILFEQVVHILYMQFVDNFLSHHQHFDYFDWYYKMHWHWQNMILFVRIYYKKLSQSQSVLCHLMMF
jgi:hypothetical protein